MKQGRRITEGEFQMLELEFMALADLVSESKPKLEDEESSDSPAVELTQGDSVITSDSSEGDATGEGGGTEDNIFEVSTHWLISELMLAIRKLDGMNWDSVEYGTIKSRSRRAFTGQPTRLRGSIQSMSSVEPMFDLLVESDVVTIEIRDDQGDLLETCPIYAPSLIDRLQDEFAAFHAFDFYGSVVPVARKKGTKTGIAFAFFLVDYAPSDQPLQIVRATKAEISKAKSTVKSLAATPGAILRHIKDSLIKFIGIKGIETAVQLETSLEFIILQSLSDGYDASRSLSHKLHSLVIGSPAVGKKLLAEAAHILNPVCTEAHPGKITVPGIAGTAIRRNGKWTSDPGLIPLAHRGTFVLQDFHHAKKKMELMGVFSMVMEDGLVIDSTAANKAHHALTSLHLDMNKTSQVRLSDEDSLTTARERLGDLGVSMNVLTRFDFIIDIPRDTMRQMEIALEMYSEGKKTKPHPGKRVHSEEARELQVLVAYLRTAYAEVEIPGDLTTGYIRTKQQELLSLNREQLEQLTLLGDYQTRLSNSIHKMVFAIARGNARAVATESDVDEAFRFVATKLEFLKTIEPFDVPSSWHSASKQEKVMARQEFIRTRFAGKESSVNEIFLAVQQHHDRAVSATTIRRDLKEIGCDQRHGAVTIPVSQTTEMAK